MKLLEIIWRDAATTSGPWYTDEEAANWAKDDYICHTLGYLYKEDARFITIACTFGPYGKVAGLWAIPKGCIIKRRVIR